MKSLQVLEEAQEQLKALNTLLRKEGWDLTKLVITMAKNKDIKTSVNTDRMPWANDI